MGKWERAILAALEQIPAFYLTDLLPEPHTRSQVVALERAAHTLANAGKIKLVRRGRHAAFDELPHGLLTVYRPGHPAPERRHITRLNVA